MANIEPADIEPANNELANNEVANVEFAPSIGPQFQQTAFPADGASPWRR
jgi:hypothetical protein